MKCRECEFASVHTYPRNGNSNSAHVGHFGQEASYQCGICDRLDVDDVSDKRFCHAGYWPGCGDPDGCREAFKPITGRGRIGVHR